MMYKLTLALFASLSLVLPVFAVPGRGPIPEIKGLEKRETYTGVGTYFIPGLGACGQTNNAGQLVVALNSNLYANGAHCEQLVQITSGGKSVVAQIVDECPTCGPTSLDLSPATFETFAPLAQGEIPITWEYV